MKPRTILCIIMSMLPVIAIAQSGPDDNILQKSFQVSSGGTLFLDAAIGTVEVVTAKTGVVAVKVVPQLKTDSVEERERLLRNLLVESTQHDNNVIVTAKFRRETTDDQRRQVRLRFEIAVPDEYNLDLNTVGSVTTTDLRGNVKVETAGGNISLGNIEGDVVARSSGGRINIAGINGGLTVDSSGGSLTAGRAGGPIQAETDGGSFTAYLFRQPHSDSSISTSGGAIELSLAPGIGLDLDAVTANGRVSTDDPSLTGPKTKRNSLQTSINGGGPKLVLRAVAGSIYLRTQAVANKR